MAVWEVDLATETLVSSPDLNRLFGLPEDSTPDIATLRSYYYPGEQERMAEQGRKAMERGERYAETDYRIIRADGEVRWLGLRCQLHVSEQGEPRRVIGVLWDVTERKGAELRHAVLAELTSRTRDFDDPEEISYVAAEVLGRALGVSRAGY
ncbi:PAS domain S-box protein, partial [Corallococcus praedator]